MVSKTVVIGESVEFIYCACGCGKSLPKFDKKNRVRQFLFGHTWLGRKHSEKTKRNFSKTRKGTTRLPYKNWDEIGIKHKHILIKKIFPKSEHPICMLCNQNPSKELACLDGGYKKDSLWCWLCYSCHKKWDNIIPRLIKNRRYDYHYY